MQALFVSLPGVNKAPFSASHCGLFNCLTIEDGGRSQLVGAARVQALILTALGDTLIKDSVFGT